jgi:hypothetical protein
MDPAYVVLAVVLVLIPIAVRAFKDVAKKWAGCDNRLTIVETMLAIYLADRGFDMQKVYRAIREHRAELKTNGNPVGCINIKELYPDKGDATKKGGLDK